MRFPHLAHRSAAAHKLHSTPPQDGTDLISGNDQTNSRLPAFSLFLPGSCPNNRNRRRGGERSKGGERSSAFPQVSVIPAALVPPTAIRKQSDKGLYGGAPHHPRALLDPIATATGLAKTVPIGKPAQMRAGTLRTWLRFPTWCCVALLGFLSLLPAQEMMRTGFPGEVEHFAAYAGSATIAMAGYGLNRSRLLIIGLFCVYAGILEYLQHLSPGRASRLSGFRGIGAGSALWWGRYHPPLALSLPSRCSTEKEAR